MPSDNSALEEIKSKLDIVEVISEYIPLKRAGQNWRGLCPFHAEKTPSFMVSPSKQIYHCFGCGTGGDIFTFLLKYENLSFQEALNILAEKAGVTLKKFQKNTAKTGEKESILNLHKDALIFYQNSLVKNQKAVRYLADRGINSKAQKLFFVGCAADSWDALFSYLQNKGYKAEEIKKSGLIVRGTKNYYDVFRNRIIFPIFNMRGEVIAFGGRVMDNSMPKYLNSPETPIFNKSRTLYGLSHAKESIKKTGTAVLVEGYLDVITAHMYGFSNTVAPLGTALT
ncbi:MAG: DNA primase, partial [Nitrospirota bacterium]